MSITEEYGADQTATGPVRSEPVVSVRGLVKRYGKRPPGTTRWPKGPRDFVAGALA